MSAVVFDTSAWISFFAGREIPELDDALRDGRVYLPPLVLGELLSGRVNERQRRELVDFLGDLPLCEAGFAHWVRVEALRSRLRERGVTLSTADAHIAQCCFDLNAVLMTENRVFELVGRHFGLRLLHRGPCGGATSPLFSRTGQLRPKKKLSFPDRSLKISYARRRSDRGGLNMSTVTDVLNNKGSHVVCVPPDSKVIDAAKRMAQQKIGAVMVTRGDEILGIFTERDLLNRVVAGDRDPKTLPVGEVMTAPVACGTPQTKLAECRAVMTRNRLRHLPIIDNGRLVGIISSGDILARENHEAQETIHYLQEYMYGRA